MRSALRWPSPSTPGTHEGEEVKERAMQQPFSDEETDQLMKDWKELHRAPAKRKRTKAWRHRIDELLPKLRAQIEWENWYLTVYFAWKDAKRPLRLV
jgi:hypothetical protein